MKNVLFVLVAIFSFSGLKVESFGYNVNEVEASCYMLVRVYTDRVSELARLGFDVARAKRGVLAEVIIPENKLQELTELGFPFDILIEDMEKYYSERMSGRGNFGDFYTYSEANAIIDSIQSFHPDIMTPRMEIGEGWEGNKIWALKLSDNPTIDEDEPEVLYHAGIHAREPITVNVVVETIRYLADRYGSDPEVTFLINNRELWFIPVVNPDGYLHNEATDPWVGGMWRKNRRTSPGPVDLNRNFPYKWGYDDWGSSTNPDAQTYRGPFAASEPETQAYIDFCANHEFVVNFNYHSYAGVLIHPWGYDGSHPSEPDYSTYCTLAEMLTTENGYPYGTAMETISYNANGTTSDWMYGDDTTKPKVFSLTPEVGGNSFWDEQSIPRNINECLPMNLKLAGAAGIYLAYKSHLIDDSGGNNNGMVDPGESAAMVVTIENRALLESANSVTSIIRTKDPYIELSNALSDFGNLGPQDSAPGIPSYVFECDPLCPDGHRVGLELDISANNYNSQTNFNVIVGELATVFFDDFESGPDKWEWDSPWGITSLASHSPSNSATDSPSGDYNNSVNISMTTIAGINLSEATYSELTFYHHYEIEAGWDYGYCEISTDGGASWSILATYTGFHTEWKEEHINLDEYCGYPNVKIRYRLDTDVWVVKDGWYIDDVMLTAPTQTNHSPSSPTLNSPSNGDTVYTSMPILVVNNAQDLDGDSLCYGFRVYSDSLLTNLVALVDNVPEEPSSTSWQVNPPIPTGTYWWRAYAADTLERGLCMETATFTIKEEGVQSTKCKVQNVKLVVYPNPFTAGVRVQCLGIGNDVEQGFSLVNLKVCPTLQIYDLSGRLVKSFTLTTHHSSLITGVIWDGKTQAGRLLPSGIYFCKLETPSSKLVKKLILIR